MGSDTGNNDNSVDATSAQGWGATDAAISSGQGMYGDVQGMGQNFDASGQGPMDTSSNRDVSWDNFLDHINNMFSAVSAAQAVGIPAPVAAIGYGFYTAANYAYNNPQKGQYQTPTEPGQGNNYAPSQVQHKPLAGMGVHPDWNSFLAEVNNRFRGAQRPSTFSSLLEE